MKCPSCGHAAHKPGLCFNAASDSSCDCQGGTAGDSTDPAQMDMMPETLTVMEF